MVPSVTLLAKPVLTLARLTISAKSGLVQRHATADNRLEGYLVRAVDAKPSMAGAEPVPIDSRSCADREAHIEHQARQLDHHRGRRGVQTVPRDHSG
jgi:hypothetical protein